MCVYLCNHPRQHFPSIIVSWKPNKSLAICLVSVESAQRELVPEKADGHTLLHISDGDTLVCQMGAH